MIHVISVITILSCSGGIFHDCAVHDIDLITWILGEYPSKVSFSRDEIKHLQYYSGRSTPPPTVSYQRSELSMTMTTFSSP